MSQTIPRTDTLEAAYARLDDVAAYAQRLRKRTSARPAMRDLLADIADDLDLIVLLPRLQRSHGDG